MDCKRFRKYIGAFADGELDVKQNLDALEHLNMCPDCAARVSEVNSVRESLQRTYGHIEAPPHLREKVEAMVRDDQRTHTRLSSRTRQVIRLFVPLGAVASVLLVVAVWRPWTPKRAPILMASDLSAQLVADARVQHDRCVWHRGANHHDPALPRDAKAIKAVLSRDLKLAVAVPELQNIGYELVGVDRCGIGQRKGSHALYHSGAPNGELSFFTVERTALLASDRVAAPPAVERIAGSHDDLSIVGWNDGPQTYVVCAEVPEHVLAEIVGAIRVQLTQKDRASRTTLAMLK